jgi:hypothetical protein
MHFEYLSRQNEVHGENGHDEVELISEVEQPALLAEQGQQFVAAVDTPKEKHFDICKECGQALLAREEGCAKCYGCGYAEC